MSRLQRQKVNDVGLPIDGASQAQRAVEECEWYRQSASNLT